MPNTTAPAPATTSTGPRLPLLALPQKRLLTLNESDIPVDQGHRRAGYPNQGPAIGFRTQRVGCPCHFRARLKPAAGCTTTPVPRRYTRSAAAGCTASTPISPRPPVPTSMSRAARSTRSYVPEGNTEDTVLYVRVSGANINFDDNGLLHSVLDAISIRAIADTRSAAQDLQAPRYIEGRETGLSERSPGTK